MSAIAGDDLLLVLRRIEVACGGTNVPALAGDDLLLVLQRIEDLLSGAVGGVTSVGMQGDGTVFNSVVPGSPVTGAGTLAPTLHVQNAREVLVGPVVGQPGTVPTFRQLTADDLHNLLGNVTPLVESGAGAVGDASTAAHANHVHPDRGVPWVSVPPTAFTDPGNAGAVAYDSDYVYVCVSLDSWRRAAIATW